jgi:hypothetical protein
MRAAAHAHFGKSADVARAPTCRSRVALDTRDLAALPCEKAMGALLLPPDFAHRRGRSCEDYIEDLRSPAVLLLALNETMTEVVAGLSEAMRAPSAKLQPSRDALGFSTTSQLLDAKAPLPTPRPPLTGRALARALSERSHFIVPLRRRTVEDNVFTERISIGRARNNDVVLRHQSVSKFHAWLETDEEDTFYIGDAKSTYATQVNGRQLESRDLPPLSSGDILTFGEIEALFCDASVLWEVLKD